MPITLSIQLFAPQNGTRYRKTEVFYELKGVQVTLPQTQYSAYEKGVNAQVHEKLWLLDAEKNLFNRDQALYYLKRHDELTTAVSNEIKIRYQKLGEVRLLYSHNDEIIKMIDEIESTPLFYSDTMEFAVGNVDVLMAQQAIVLAKYKEICDRLFDTLKRLNELIKSDLFSSRKGN